MFLTADDIPYFENLDIHDIVTLVKVDELAKLLKLSAYQEMESYFLVKGFSEGLDLGYEFSTDQQAYSKNLQFTEGDKFQLWLKAMKEIENKWYVCPYQKIPFNNFIQSL